MLHRVSPTHLDTDLLKLSQKERGTAEVTKPHARALSEREATDVLFLMSAPCPLSNLVCSHLSHFAPITLASDGPPIHQ